MQRFVMVWSLWRKIKIGEAQTIPVGYIGTNIFELIDCYLMWHERIL